MSEFLLGMVIGVILTFVALYWYTEKRWENLKRKLCFVGKKNTTIKAK